MVSGGGPQHHLVQHQHLHPSNQHMMMMPSNHQAGNNKQGSKGNLTFSVEQLQEMERENERLLGSMIAIHRRRGSSGTFSVNQQYMRGGRQPSSSSINRQKQAREIQRANQVRGPHSSASLHAGIAGHAWLMRPCQTFLLPLLLR